MQEVEVNKKPVVIEKIQNKYYNKIAFKNKRKRERKICIYVPYILN